MLIWSGPVNPMQVGVIADIQGNAFALETVLALLKQSQVDRIICLGDLVSGPEPHAVLDLLRSHDVISVRGNMDDVILDPADYHGVDVEQMRYARIDRWCHDQLSQADRTYLNGLPLTHSLEFGSLNALCFHGSPSSMEDVIDGNSPVEYLYEVFKDYQERYLLTGHMHLPMLRSLGPQIVLNPGSVGLPYGGKRMMPTRAEYAILGADQERDRVTFCNIQYDPSQFAERVLQSGMPHAEWFLSKWQI